MADNLSICWYNRHMRALELAGKRFGRLVVIRLDTHRGVKRRWLCQCDCGNTSIAFVADLTSGKHVSCGCWQKQVVAGIFTKHGASNTCEYETWSRMKQRCLDPNHPRYRDYGGRGITVSPEWRDSFERFLADMGPRPVGRSLDRIDNNDGYSASNCRWATDKEQAQNQRRSFRPRNALGRFSR
jgi:hypothetical protein